MEYAPRVSHFSHFTVSVGFTMMPCINRTDRFLRALRKFQRGNISTRCMLKLIRAYRGTCRHLLWDRPRSKKENVPYIYHVFDELSEEKVIELLSALIADDSNFPLIRSQKHDTSAESHETFLHVAMDRAHKKSHEGLDPNTGSTSFGVLRLLMVPGVTRLRSGGLPPHTYDTPILHATLIPRLDPAVVDRLLDLDPGALLVGPDRGLLPLHHAMYSWTPSSGSAVRRMVERAPEALTRTCTGGRTPVAYTLQNRVMSAEVARALTTVVQEHPEAVQPCVGSAFGTALVAACRNPYPDLGLINAIVRAFPPALCLPDPNSHNGKMSLPYETVAERARGGESLDGAVSDLLRAGTIHMSLASVEYALDATGSVAETATTSSISITVAACGEASVMLGKELDEPAMLILRSWTTSGGACWPRRPAPSYLRVRRR